MNMYIYDDKKDKTDKIQIDNSTIQKKYTFGIF